MGNGMLPLSALSPAAGGSFSDLQSHKFVIADSGASGREHLDDERWIPTITDVAREILFPCMSRLHKTERRRGKCTPDTQTMQPI